MTLQELNRSIKGVLSKVRKEADSDFLSYLSSLLSLYKNEISQLEGLQNLIPSDFDEHQLIERVQQNCDMILSIVKAYLSAEVVSSINLMQDMLYINKKISPIYQMAPDKCYYRMRVLPDNSTSLFPKEEMFHIPFDKRTKVSNQRYSINGLPCLYLGNSLIACWEELNEPHYENFCVSRIQASQEVKLLDLRIPSNDYADKNVKANYQLLCLWPLMIACSIKVQKQEEPFKPEYIIPQLLMLSLIQTEDVKGCIYVSTKLNPVFHSWGDKLYDNIAIPVSGLDNGNRLSRELCAAFKITDPISYKYEILKYYYLPSLETEYKDGYLTMRLRDDYEHSIFGDLETRLKEYPLYEL